MFRFVVLLVLAVGCLAQQNAQKKCKEYTAHAKAKGGEGLCPTYDDKISGVAVEPEEFPGVAVLGFVTPSGDILYLCDATLISEDTLLTAGHCVQQKKFGKPKWARLGATYTTLGQEVEVKQSICHPHYSPGNDIAVIKLKEKLNSSYIPACLDTEETATGLKGMGVGRPIGNAYTKLGEKCPLKAALEVRSEQECVETYPRQNITTDAILCTKAITSGPGDCLSGPLYVLREPCVYTLSGLASFGKPCINKASDNRSPSVYTRVAHHIQWIETHTWPDLVEKKE